MTNGNLESITLILEIVKSLSLGAGAIVLMIVAYQSPQILREVLSFIRLTIKDWRAQPKVKRELKAPQISKPQ